MTALIGYTRVPEADGSRIHDLQRDALAAAETAAAGHLLPAIERLLRNSIRRISSATAVPVSACVSANAICSSLCLVLLRPSSYPQVLSGGKTVTQRLKTGTTFNGLE